MNKLAGLLLLLGACSSGAGARPDASGSAAGMGGAGRDAEAPDVDAGAAGAAGADALEAPVSDSAAAAEVVNVPSGLTGLHSFQVTSTIQAGYSVPRLTSPFTFDYVPVPTSQKITLVLDADKNQVFVGDDAIPVTFDGTLFHLSQGFSYQGVSSEPSVSYSEVAFSIDAGGLHGTSHARSYGQTKIEGPDLITTVDLGAAPLVGPADTTPATFRTPFDALPSTGVDPFFPFDLIASKPLPLTHPLRLLGSAGDVITYAPFQSTSTTAARSFVAPKIILGYGATYRLDDATLVDFAGMKPAAFQFQTVAKPPLAGTDGFESAAAGAYGGGTIITGVSGEPAVIAGKKSWFVKTRFQAGGAFSPLTCATRGTARAAIRLTIPTGATTLSLSMVTLGSQVATFSLGVPGGPRKDSESFGSTGTSTPMPITISLPAAPPPELTLTVSSNGGCELASVTAGVVIDDLKVQ